MSLQNRVTPFGEIAAVGGRGLVMGNRGILHDDNRRIVRYSQVRRWLACRTEFRQIRRVVMRPHSYTELFFLDEATSFAAGHRPCAECRRPDYRRFCDLWAMCHGEPVSADIIDRRLQRERIIRPRVKQTYNADLASLPDGAYVAIGDRAWLVWSDALFAWSPQGYAECRERSPREDVKAVLYTPVYRCRAGSWLSCRRPSIRREMRTLEIRRRRSPLANHWLKQ